MRKILFIVAGAGLLVMALAPVVVGDGGSRFEARLDGYQEVTSISTPADGTFRARITKNTIEFRLRYEDLPTSVLFAHIHFARPDTNGGVAAFLCGGGGKPACPQGGGTVTGTIVAADVLAQNPDRGLGAGEFAEFVKAIRNGATYVNVHTTQYPGGELRGNIRRD